MSTTNEHVTQLREANQIVKKLEDKFDEHGQERTSSIRSSLKRAGKKVGYTAFDNRLHDAMGETAGLAINHGWYDLADQALRLVDDDATSQNGDLETVEDEVTAETVG